MASNIVVAITANLIPDSLNFAELNTRPNPNASFRAFSRMTASYPPSAR
jgi:hypothetical protein